MANRQRIIPMLSYENGPAAMDFLIRAFGFEEGERWLDDEGRLSHGELSRDGFWILLATPTPLYQSPKTIRENYAPAAKFSEVPYVIDGIYVEVDDVDALFARAKSAGAVMLSEVQESVPGRVFRCEDIEGHRWMVCQPIDPA